MRRHVIHTLAGSGLAQAFSVALYWFCARLFGPTEYGDIVALTTLALFLAVAGNAGSAAYLTQGLASGDMTPEEFAAALWRRVFRAIVLAGVVVGFGVVSGNSWSATGSSAVLVPIAVLSQNVLIVPRASSSFAIVGAATAIDKCVALALALVLGAFSGLGAELLPLALISGSVAGTCIVVLATSRRSDYYMLRSMRPGRAAALERRVSGWYAGAGLILAVQSLDVLALRGIAGATVAGEYAAVSKWGQPLAMVLSATNQVTLTSVAAASSAGEARRTLRRTWPLVVAVACVACIGSLASGVLVEVLLGPAYRNSAPVLSLLMLGSMMSALSQSMLTFYLGRRSPAIVTRAFFFAVLAQFVLIVCLAPSAGALGGAVAWTASQCAILVLMGVPFLFEGNTSN